MVGQGEWEGAKRTDTSRINIAGSHNRAGVQASVVPIYNKGKLKRKKWKEEKA